MLQSSATPCPVPTRHNRHPHIRDSILSVGGGEEDNTTANLDFTSAFGHSSLKNVKPRRRHTAVVNNNKTSNNHNAGDFAIFEDVEAEQQYQSQQKPNHASRVGSTSLAQPTVRRSVIAQPPQRPKHGVSFAPPGESEPRVPESNSKPSRRLSLAPPRRPVMKHDSSAQQQAQPQQLASLPEDHTAGLDMFAPTTTMLKPARRGTIYIPSDDTTMPSMYMGIFSPIKALDKHPSAHHVSSSTAPAAVEPEITGIAARMAEKKRIAAPRRRSTMMMMMAVSPKRGAPLQIATRPVQETAMVEDRHGQGTGKENVPPGCHDAANKAAKLSQKVLGMPRRIVEESQYADEVAGLRLTAAEPKSSRLFEPTASSQGKAMDRKYGGSREREACMERRSFESAYGSGSDNEETITWNFPCSEQRTSPDRCREKAYGSESLYYPYDQSGSGQLSLIFLSTSDRRSCNAGHVRGQLAHSPRNCNHTARQQSLWRFFVNGEQIYQGRDVAIQTP